MRHLVLTLALAATVAGAAPPSTRSAAPKAPPPAKTGAGPSGEVDWREQVIRATGSGAPDLKAANPAQARLAAEKAAQLDAFRNLLAQVKGIQISAGRQVSDLLGESDEVRAKVEGSLRGFRVVKKRYFSDSGVELDVEVPLSSLVELLPPHTPPPGKTGGMPTKGGTHSSVVVDASGLTVAPALAPRLVDEKGGVVFAAEMVDEAARKDGVAHYARTIEEAKKSRWAGDKPLVLKATKADGTDLVLADGDAKSVAEGARPGSLSKGHVIIVLGGI